MSMLHNEEETCYGGANEGSVKLKFGFEGGVRMCEERFDGFHPANRLRVDIFDVGAKEKMFINDDTEVYDLVGLGKGNGREGNGRKSDVLFGGKCSGQSLTDVHLQTTFDEERIKEIEMNPEENWTMRLCKKVVSSP